MALNIDRFIEILNEGNINDEDLVVFKDYWDQRDKTEQYIPSEREMDIILNLTGLSHDYLNDAYFKMIAPGILSVRSNRRTWLALIGREYLIDLNNKKGYLICLN